MRDFTRASAEAFVGRYPAGRRLPCFVNPAAPHQAVLDRGFVPPLDWLNAFLSILAAAFLTIGLGTFGRTWRVERGS